MGCDESAHKPKIGERVHKMGKLMSKSSQKFQNRIRDKNIRDGTLNIMDPIGQMKLCKSTIGLGIVDLSKLPDY
jgi:hypothetical protein